MLSCRLVSLFLCSQLYFWHSYTRAFTPSTIALGERDGRDDFLLPASYGSPPKPWNQHICRNEAAYPGISLTFSWGAKHSTASIVALFRTAREFLGHIISAGQGDRSVPSLENVVLGNSGGSGVFMVARSLKRRFRTTEPFTFNQASQAVELLQICGLDRGRREEMWANVFVGKKQVGYIYMGPYSAPGHGNHQNETFNLSVS